MVLQVEVDIQEQWRVVHGVVAETYWSSTSYYSSVSYVRVHGLTEGGWKRLFDLVIGQSAVGSSVPAYYSSGTPSNFEVKIYACTNNLYYHYMGWNLYAPFPLFSSKVGNGLRLPLDSYGGSYCSIQHGTKEVELTIAPYSATYTNIPTQLSSLI
mgnify:FL=1